MKALPLDLHVLGTPPAFILSQDQTLHKKESNYSDFCPEINQGELTLIRETSKIN